MERLGKLIPSAWNLDTWPITRLLGSWTNPNTVVTDKYPRLTSAFVAFRERLAGTTREFIEVLSSVARPPLLGSSGPLMWRFPLTLVPAFPLELRRNPLEPAVRYLYRSFHRILRHPQSRSSSVLSHCAIFQLHGL